MAFGGGATDALFGAGSGNGADQTHQIHGDGVFSRCAGPEPAQHPRQVEFRIGKQVSSPEAEQPGGTDRFARGLFRPIPARRPWLPRCRRPQLQRLPATSPASNRRGAPSLRSAAMVPARTSRPAPCWRSLCH